MNKEISSEGEIVSWFKKNYKELGYDKIIKENKNTFPDFVMLKEGKKLNVEIEIKSSFFFLHKHPLDKVDEIICLEEDKKIDKKIILLENFRYLPPKAKRVSISLNEEQMEVLNSIKGLGTKEAEKVKNIFMAYLSEKGYLAEFNKNDKWEKQNE